MKKFLASLLVLVIAIALVPQGLFTIDVHAATSGDFTYTVSNGEATITDFPDDYSGALIIPSTLDGYPVTSIGNSAFRDCDNLTSVTIPRSITYIGFLAFYDCDKLTSIIIPDSVTSIDTDAFGNCYELIHITVDADNIAYCSVDGVLFNKDKTTLIQYPAKKQDVIYHIPDTVLSISNDAFRGCENLTSVTIPNSVISIGRCAFIFCYGLTSVIIPKTISISDSAFGYCHNLKSVGYASSESDRSNMTIERANDYLLNATWYYNYCGNDAHTYTDGCDDTCNTCQWPRTGEHTYDNSLDKDCNLCSHARTFEEFPIVSISAEPITVMEGTNGGWSGTRPEDGPWYYYFSYNTYPTYTLTMADDLTFTGVQGEIYNLVGKFPYASTGQSFENQWGVGVHTVPVSLGSFSCQFTVTITESPIESISAAPITLYEDANGWLTYDHFTGEHYFEYTYYDQLIATVFYKDGSTKTVTTSDFDGMYYLSHRDEQSAAAPWGLGTHTATVCYGHLTCEVDVTILPNPIESIELVTLPKTEYVVGECFDLTGAVMRVHFNDHTYEDIAISHYFNYGYDPSQYYCNKIHASDRIIDSHSPFSSAGEETVTLTYFGKSTTLPVTVAEKNIKDISINDNSKNLVITMTYTDNTKQEMTALSFAYQGDMIDPEFHMEGGILRTDKGSYVAEFVTYLDGSVSLVINDVTSNILENGCKWYERYEMYPGYGPDFSGQITADNIDDLVNYVIMRNLDKIEYDNGWFKGSDIRNAILMHYAVDSVDLSLHPNYDKETDRIQFFGAGDVAGSLIYPATLIYKNGYWEFSWITRYETNLENSYVRLDDDGRVLRVSHGAPIITYGDPTDDMIVDSRDLVLIRKFMANFDYDTNTSTVDVAGGADTNGDGVIDARDLVLLRQYFANYDYDSGSSSVVLGPQN